MRALNVAFSSSPIKTRTVIDDYQYLHIYTQLLVYVQRYITLLFLNQTTSKICQKHLHFMLTMYIKFHCNPP